MPDETSLQRLISEAKSNPEFFYRLVWDTERAVEEVDYLSPAQKESILAVQPEDLVVGLASNPGKAALVSREAFEEFDLSAVCGASCGASCGGSCAASCAGSCGGSCGGSCCGGVLAGVVAAAEPHRRQCKSRNWRRGGDLDRGSDELGGILRDAAPGTAPPSTPDEQSARRDNDDPAARPAGRR